MANRNENHTVSLSMLYPSYQVNKYYFQIVTVLNFQQSIIMNIINSPERHLNNPTLVNLSTSLSQGCDSIVNRLPPLDYNLVDELTGVSLSEVDCITNQTVNLSKV